MKIIYFLYFCVTWCNLFCFGFAKIKDCEEQQKDKVVFQETNENDCINFCKSNLKCKKYEWKNDTCFLILSSVITSERTTSTAPDLSIAPLTTFSNNETLLLRIKRKGGHGGGGRGSSGSRGSSSSSRSSSHSSYSSSSHLYYGSSGGYGGGGGNADIMRNPFWFWFTFTFIMFWVLVLIWCIINNLNEYVQSKNLFRPPQQYPPPPRGTVPTPFYNNYPAAECQRAFNPPPPPPYPTASLLKDENNETKESFSLVL